MARPVPILIPCYNNWYYVQNMTEQLVKKNPMLKSSIIILNNSSTCPETKTYLQSCPYQVIHNANNGPWVTSTQNQHIYNQMPTKFIVTDPDLALHPQLPSNFVDILCSLSDTYKTYKVGFALDISEPDKMIDYPTIFAQENLYWKHRIAHPTYELYSAAIDTTFALLNKEYHKNSIRIAGVFTAKHLPWYIRNPILTPRENYEYYKHATKYSSFAKIFVAYFDKHNLLEKLEEELREEAATTTS